MPILTTRVLSWTTSRLMFWWKRIRRIIREDLNNRYTEKAKRVMHMACFIDPHFKTSFLNEPEAATVDS